MWGGGYGESKYPSLVTGVAFDKPSARVAENGLRSIDHLIDNPNIPRGTVVTDCAYYPNPKLEKWGIPLREAGYKLLGDFKTGETLVTTVCKAPKVERCLSMAPGFVLQF